MSLPDSFKVFSPTLRLFEKLGPEEYLVYSEKLLRFLPQAQTITKSVAIVALAFFAFANAIAVASDEDRITGNKISKTSQFFKNSANVSLFIASFAAVTLPILSFALKPLLSSRIEWLQTLTKG